MWTGERLIEMSKSDWHNKGFLPVPNAVRTCFGLSANDREVLYELLWSMGENQGCYPSIVTIARKLNISESTAIRSIRKLQEMHFIYKRMRLGSSNYYEVEYLEDNPYLLLSDIVNEFKSNFISTNMPKELCKKNVIQWANAFTETEEFTNYAEALLSENEEKYRIKIMDDFKCDLAEFVHKETGVIFLISPTLTQFEKAILNCVE